MFKLNNIDLGEINVGQNLVFGFPWDDTVKFPSHIDFPCDCATVYPDLAKKEVMVNYTPKPIPIHLVQQGKTFYEVIKTITVKCAMVDGTEQETKLIFTAKIK